VFDENIFPFKSLHPNVGAQLRAEILLLPDTLSSLSHAHEGVTVDDPMHIVPVTDALQVSGDSSANADSNSKVSGENLTQNDAQTSNLRDIQNSTDFCADSHTRRSALDLEPGSPAWGPPTRFCDASGRARRLVASVWSVHLDPHAQ
jgi:hypothetical protein